MRYVPSEGRVIVKQVREEKSSGGILLSTDAQSKKTIAEVVATPNDVTNVDVGQKVFFDKSAGTLIEDTGSEVYTVIDIEDILAFVYEE